MFPFETTPDPNSVVAGWIPAVLIGVLIIVTAFLFFSMRKQMRRIHIPPEGVPTRADHERKSDAGN